MVLYKTRAVRLFSRGLISLGLLVLAAFCGYGLARAGNAKPTAAEERLHALLTQRYEVLKGMGENSELSLNAGRATFLDHQGVLTALYRAQADLATTSADRIGVYEKLVDVLTSMEQSTQRQADAGRLTGVQLAQYRIGTLNAQIDLERLRLGQVALQP